MNPLIQFKRISLPLFIVSVLACFALSPANAAITTNQSMPFTERLAVLCPGSSTIEFFDISGTVHTLITFTINGNNVSGVLHINAQGATAISETTGLTYRVTSSGSESFKTSMQNGQANMTLVQTINFLSRDSNTILFRFTEHFTFNADGTVTVMFTDISLECH
jgi:hypothetical protein